MILKIYIIFHFFKLLMFPFIRISSFPFILQFLLLWSHSPSHDQLVPLTMRGALSSSTAQQTLAPSLTHPSTSPSNGPGRSFPFRARNVFPSKTLLMETRVTPPPYSILRHSVLPWILGDTNVWPVCMWS